MALSTENVFLCKNLRLLSYTPQQKGDRMDAKDTWPVVKFLIAGTGLKRRDVRQMLEEIPEEKYSKLFVRARNWDRDQAARASAMLSEIIGEENLPTLLAATQMARTPVAAEEASPKRRPRKR